MEKKLVRVTSQKKLGGVCAGLARYFGLDLTLVRVAYAVLTLCTASVLFWIYIALWLVMPEEK